MGIRLEEETLKTLRLLFLDLTDDPEALKIFIKNHYKPISNALMLSQMTVLKNLLLRGSNYHLDVLKRLLNLRRIFEKERGAISDGKPRYIVRVDDFPRWDLDLRLFMKFHQIMEKHSIPYLLGVTPLLSLDPLNSKNKKFRRLKQEELFLLRSPLITVGLHGFTHQTISNHYRTEFVGLDPETVDSKILKAIEIMHQDNLSPTVFIPPFNSLDKVSFVKIEKHFKVITGGPESIKTLGLRASPIVLDRSMYVPSYKPFYDRAGSICDCLRKLVIKDCLIIPLTLHWAWEVPDGFASLEMLCKRIKSQVVDWNEFYKDSVRVLAK